MHTATIMPPRSIKVSRYGKTVDEQKAAIYNSIKKNNLDFKQIMQKFKVSRSCAFKYIKKCAEISHEQEFFKKTGRKPILSDRTVLDARKKYDQETKQYRPLNSAVSATKVETATEALEKMLAEQSIKEGAENTAVLTPKMVYHLMHKSSIRPV